MQDEHLEACPFCGHTEIDQITKFTGNYRYGKPVYIVFMKCSLCGVSTRSFPYIVDNTTEYENAANQAAECWNRRCSDNSKKRSGRWIVERDGYCLWAQCSACKKEFPYEKVISRTNCPNCDVLICDDTPREENNVQFAGGVLLADGNYLCPDPVTGEWTRKVVITNE